MNEIDQKSDGLNGESDRQSACPCGGGPIHMNRISTTDKYRCPMRPRPEACPLNDPSQLQS